MSSNRSSRYEQEELRRRKALADLAALENGAEGLPGSGMGNAFQATMKRLQALGHDIADTHSDDDPAERWGKLVGRGLGFVVVGYLIWHLFSTYVLK